MRKLNNMGVTYFVSLFGLVFSFGCGVEREIDGYDENSYEASTRSNEFAPRDATRMENARQLGDVNISHGSLHGNIGDIYIDGAASSLDGYEESDYATIYTIVENRNTTAMTIVDLIGGFDHEDFEVGESAQYDIDDHYELEPGQSFVQVIGCSGDDPMDWEFDDTAESVNILVQEGAVDGQMTFQYTARFRDFFGTETLVTGQFDATR